MRRITRLPVKKYSPELISSVYGALSRASRQAVEPEPVELKPAVAIKKSVTSEYIICLEDGQKFKSLKRHLKSHYDMSPEEYREKWGLPRDYPMVAPSYAATRSDLAKNMGLGRRGSAVLAAVPEARSLEKTKGRGQQAKKASNGSRNRPASSVTRPDRRRVLAQIRHARF